VLICINRGYDRIHETYGVALISRSVKDEAHTTAQTTQGLNKMSHVSVPTKDAKLRCAYLTSLVSKYRPSLLFESG
jgi:hypothetical protein